MITIKRHYVELLGLLSVVVLSSKWIKTRKASNIIEDIVCFKAEKPHRVTVQWIVHKKLGLDYNIMHDEEITEKEYERLAEEG